MSPDDYIKHLMSLQACPAKGLAGNSTPCDDPLKARESGLARRVAIHCSGVYYRAVEHSTV